MSNSDSWTAVYVSKRGAQVRFPLYEDANGKLFLKISGEAVAYKIGLEDSYLGTLIHFRTERIEQDKTTTTEEK
jgi:hypothetical protein